MIYLVRHGQTEFNLARRIQGALDSPLTQLGERQARAVGALLADLTADGSDWEIVSSPQGRARRTAELIAEACPTLPLAFDERLAEVSLGAWDGLTFEEILAADPRAGEARVRWDWYFTAPEGESYEVLAGRLAEWLNEATLPGRRMIAVSHGVAGRVLRGLYGRMPREAALKLDVPQDAVFRLVGGQVERIDCASALSA